MGKRSVVVVVGVFGLSGMLAGCGVGGSSGISAISGAFTEFPLGLAISSPLDTTGEVAVVMRQTPNTLFAWAENGLRQMRSEWQTKNLLAFIQDTLVPNAHAAVKAPRYTWATLRIQSLLDGSGIPASAFSPARFLMQGNDAACYGPQVVYQDNPDAALPNNGTLPTGDVGFWRDTDDTTTAVASASNQACAAAQLNARMSGVSWRANQSLMGLAIVLRRLYATGASLPSAGTTVNLLASMPAIPNVTWTAASIDQMSAGTYAYTLSFSYVDGGAVSHPITITLRHTPGADGTHYSGQMTYTVGDKFTGGNCGPGLNDVTVIGTLQYTRNGLNSMNLAQRQGQYCGGAVTLAGKQDVSGGATDGLLLPASAWADNFSRLSASYDPVNLAGSYLYTWQAGFGDGNARIMQLRLNGSTSNGEAFYGYGDSIQTTTGSIRGMICNWAGPGSNHGTYTTATEYAQRQFVQWNAGTELWEVPVGGSDIRYAPTNSCLYDGTGTFQYDRDLDGSHADETAAELNVTNTGAGTDLDLFDKGVSATIQTAITARGYVPPSVF